MAGARKSPFSGTYAPSKLSMSKKEVIEGLKGIKIKHPNRYMTTTAYKTGIKKSPESGAEKE